MFSAESDVFRNVHRRFSYDQRCQKKLAGTALNIAENAKISESVLKMTEYL